MCRPVALLFSALLIWRCDAEAEWQKLCKMFDGEFDNYDQIEDLSCRPQFGGCTGEEHGPLHSTFRRVDNKANLTGVLTGDGCVLYVEQYQELDPKAIYRQKLYVIAPDLTMSLWGFANPDAVKGADRHPELLDGISSPLVYDLKGCEVMWRWDDAADMFKGQTKPDTCTLVLNGTKYTITDDNTLSDNFITIHEHWTPTPSFPGTNKKIADKLYRWREASQQVYNGFVYASNPKNTSQGLFKSNITLLNNGQIQRIPVGDMAWYVEVAVCHYSLNETAQDHAGAEVLKLAVYYEGGKQAMTYAWVHPGTASVGLTYRDVTATNVLFQSEFKLVNPTAEPSSQLAFV